MVKKLLVVSDDAYDIWYHFNLQQPGFFIKVIMDEYGIDKNFSRKVLDDYDEQVEALQAEFDLQIRTISKGYQDQIQALTQRNHELIRDVSSLKLQLGPALDALRAKIDTDLLARFGHQMEEFLKTKSQQLKYKQQVIEKQYANLDTMRERLLEQKKINAKLQMNNNNNNANVQQVAPKPAGTAAREEVTASQAFMTQSQAALNRFGRVDAAREQSPAEALKVRRRHT